MMGRRGLLTALAGVAALAGCSASDPVEQAQATADRLFPGELQVIDASLDIGGPVPVPIIRARFAVVDDPDAIVVVTRLSDRALREAVEHGRWLADELRSLEEMGAAAGMALVAFSDAGPVGVRRGTIQVRADLTDANRAELMAAIDTALAHWHAERSPVMPLDLVQIDLVPAAAAADEPVADNGLPRVTRFTDPARIDRLRGRAVWALSVGTTPDGDMQRPSAQLRPRLDETAQETMGRTVRSEVQSWLDAQDMPGQVTPEGAVGWSFVLADSLDLLRVYVLVCPPGQDQCNTNTFITVIGATVDLGDHTVSDLTDLELEPRPGGGLALPLEPDLHP